MFRGMKWILPLAAAVVAIVLTTLPSSATHVAPTLVPGNPTCADLGYARGFKPLPEPPPSGTYAFPGDPGNSVTITRDGAYFDWTSTLGIDAVIVKGGPNANLYVYQPPAESFGDAGLHTPINPNNNKPYGLSHIQFCYDYELVVEKTAEPSFARTFAWEIEKRVSPGEWHLFRGDSGTSEYTIAISKTGFEDSDWAVSGTILIFNPDPVAAATITAVSDTITGIGPVAVECGVSFPYGLAPGESLLCTYSSALPDDLTRTNTVVVSTTGAVGGGQASAVIVFLEPTIMINAQIAVEDSMQGDLGTFGESAEISYRRTFVCDRDQGQHENIATAYLHGASMSASATVTVHCYSLEMQKDAQTSFTRTWRWRIEKSANHTALTLAPGQQHQVEYWVTMTPSYEDGDWAVDGQIWIGNPHPTQDAELTGVSDEVSPDILALVDCPSLIVPAGDWLQCVYTADLPDAADRINSATATQQNYDYDPQGNASPAGTTDYGATADVDFDTAVMNEVDEIVAVSDSLHGHLGVVLAQNGAWTFHYWRWVGPFSDPEDCGENLVVNTASFLAFDSEAAGEASWTIVVTVPCERGCTLTQGYWKTHSDRGPAPFDDTWNLIPGGSAAPFFLSGQSHYEVLWTPPRGNAYYILAHQYVAAKLNMLNGASVPLSVLTAFNSATGLFNTYTPAQIAALKGNSPIRQQFIQLGGILDDYNSGRTGPGHCSE